MGTTGLGLGAGVTRGTVEGLLVLTSRPGFGTGLLLITLPWGPTWLATGFSGARWEAGVGGPGALIPPLGLGGPGPDCPAPGI